MGTITFWERVRQKISYPIFRVFLWVSGYSLKTFLWIYEVNNGLPVHCEHGHNGLCPTCDAMMTPKVA